MGKADGPNRIRHWLPRYSLRSFLVFFTAVALWFCWLAFVGDQQRAVLRIVKESGGSVYYKYQVDKNATSPPIRTWIASKLGEELVFSIAGIYLEGGKVDDDTAKRLAPHLEKLRYLKWMEFRDTKVSNEGMQHIDGLSSLERLFVRRSQKSGMFDKPPVPIQITDVGLESIANLTNLKVLAVNYAKVNGEGFADLRKLSKIEDLDFGGTDIEDASLEHLKGLAKLKQINLRETDISDAGLVHLSALPKLENVILSNTKVTDTGLQFLTEKVKLRIIDVAHTAVTDIGLVNLARLSSLHELRLNGTRVSDAGLTHFAGLKNLRVLQLRNTNITDSSLAKLESWTHLKELGVSGNQGVTNNAIVRLRNALPQCRVY